MVHITVKVSQALQILKFGINVNIDTKLKTCSACGISILAVFANDISLETILSKLNLEQIDLEFESFTDCHRLMFAEVACGFTLKRVIKQNKPEKVYAQPKEESKYVRAV